MAKLKRSERIAPGPWRPEHWSGGEGYPSGWYVARTNNGRTEWLKDSLGLRRFAGEESAKAAIDALSSTAKATRSRA